MIKFVGRDKEELELNQYLDELNANKGSIILISGEPGIGKTSFAEETVKNRKLKAYSIRANPESRIPYSLFTGVFRNCLRTHSGSINCGPYTKYLSAILPELGDNNNDTDQETLTQAIISGIIHMGSNEPVIIHFDDIHWADNASLDILPALADKISGYPVVIICTYRSDEITREHRVRKLRSELRRIRKLKEIALNHLSYTDSKILTEAILKKPVSSSAYEIIFKHTQGIPLFIEEMIDSLIEQKLLTLENDEYILTSKNNLPVPENVKDAVLQKFSALTPEAKLLLEYASLLGRDFEPGILINIAGKNELALAELFEKSWLRQADSSRVSFKHALIREAIKNEISWPLKKKMHKEIALFLEKTGSAPVYIAEHWMRTNEPGKAAKWLLESLDQFCSVCAYSDASETAKKILDNCSNYLDNNERISVLKKYAYCTQITGNFRESEKTLKEIIELADVNNFSLLAEIYRSLAVIYGLQGQGELSVLSRIKSAEYFESAYKYNEAAAEYLVSASRYTAMVQHHKAMVYSEKAAQVAEKCGNLNLVTRAMALHGNINSMMGNFSEGKKIVDDALRIALDNDDIDAASEIYRRLASTLEYGSDYTGARTAYLNAYNFCVNNGRDINARVCLSCMSYIFFQTGEWKKAIDICRDFLKNEHTPPTSLPVGYGIVGMVHALRGETKTAFKYLNEALALSRKYNVALSEMLILWGIAVAYDTSGSPVNAENYYKTMISKWRETQDVHDVIPCLMWASIFFNENNLNEELTATLEIITSISVSTGKAEAMGAQCFIIGESASFQNNFYQALEKYKQALEHFEKLELPLEKLLIEYRYSVAAVKCGDMETASKFLSRSYRTAKNLGIRPLASRIAENMTSIGLKTEEPRNPEAPSRAVKFGLTQRQAEILQLIGEGLTNKEIGTKLFLSSRTVDMHVSNILQRLNCRTRTEAIVRVKELAQ